MKCPDCDLKAMGMCVPEACDLKAKRDQGAACWSLGVECDSTCISFGGECSKVYDAIRLSYEHDQECRVHGCSDCLYKEVC